MKAKIILILLLCFNISWSQNVKSNSDVYSLKNDTLKSYLSNCDAGRTQVFRKLINITIDSRFKVIDSIKCKLNYDDLNDYIFLLSNNIQEENLPSTKCDRKYNRRLIVIFLSKKNTFQILINQNIILNNWEYQSEPVRGVKCAKKGFILSFYVGTRIRYYYDFLFKLNKDGFFYLTHSESESNDIHKNNSGQQRIRNYPQNSSTNFKNIDIRKFIKYY
jgi:hypothetical protein